MTSTVKRVPKGAILAFKIVSIIAKVLFVPVLILTVLMTGVFNDSKPLNNIDNGVELPQYSSEESVRAGWGYYMIPVVDDLGQESVYYAQKISESEIEVGSEIVFYDIVDKNNQPFEYRINVKIVIGTEESESGEILYQVNGNSFAIPVQNIIGEVIEEIPAIFKFFMLNLNSITALLVFGILPLVLILAVFVIDSTIYLKTKQGRMQRSQLLSKTEEENINYFEQLKKAYLAPMSKAMGNAEGDDKSGVPAKPEIAKTTLKPEQSIEQKPAVAPASLKPVNAPPAQKPTIIPKEEAKPKAPPAQMPPKSAHATKPTAPKPPTAPPVPPKKG